jgi:aspartyl-tRNA(Asn)/glutamyl-tRNA(Gln) amidotransferase subunit A
VTDLFQLSAGQLLAAFRTGETSPVDVVEALADRIAAIDGSLGAFTTLCTERALDEARAAEREYVLGRPSGRLTGVPFAVKDLFDSEGVRTMYGSPMFANNVPAADAETVRRARQEGAILIGKTQTHEFAWGITSVNTLLGTSRNPWSEGRISGGSSGGSAVALASRQIPIALGTDTGGSIRVPSALCGTVGFKPTYGRVSLAGVWPLARTLDHAGPMARTPSDAMLLLEAIAGHDPNDPALRDVPLGDVQAAFEQGLEGMAVGVSPNLHLVPLTPRIEAIFAETVRTIEGLGARVEEVMLPEAASAYRTFGVIQRAEALFTHREAGLYPARSDEYGPDVRSRLELAMTEDVSDYLRAAKERERIRAGFARVFAEVDLLLTPVAAGPPVAIGEETLEHLGARIEFRELVMSYTVPQDLVGLPACVVRAGFDESDIPVGLQLTGPEWSDVVVLGAAEALYQATRSVQDVWPEFPAVC